MPALAQLFSLLAAGLLVFLLLPSAILAAPVSGAAEGIDRRASITHSFARREPAFAQRDTTLHVGQRDTTVDLRVGFDTGGVAKSNWAIKRQTNDIPAQLPTKGSAAGGIIPFVARSSFEQAINRRQVNSIPEQNPTKGSVAGGIEPYA